MALVAMHIIGQENNTINSTTKLLRLLEKVHLIWICLFGQRDVVVKILENKVICWTIAEPVSQKLIEEKSKQHKDYLDLMIAKITESVEMMNETIQDQGKSSCMGQNEKLDLRGIPLIVVVTTIIAHDIYDIYYDMYYVSVLHLVIVCVRGLGWWAKIPHNSNTEHILEEPK